MLEKLIKNTEEKWLKLLFDCCERQFSGVHLPSHDQHHHMRVWGYAKNLVKLLSKHNITLNETELERLIIAVFFHDQGMSETISKDHGKISRHLCKKFFNTHESLLPPHFEEILDAIESHDKKEYSLSDNNQKKSDLRKILNIADDLDAFGILGAYRYIEIYVLRGMNTDDLSEPVLENLHKRYLYFADNIHFDKTFVKSQNQRYIATRNFFKDLNFQLKNNGNNPDIRSGPLGVISYIQNYILGNKMSVNDAGNKVLSVKQDFYIEHFFKKLLKESCL